MYIAQKYNVEKSNRITETYCGNIVAFVTLICYEY